MNNSLWTFYAAFDGDTQRSHWSVSLDEIAFEAVEIADVIGRRISVKKVTIDLSNFKLEETGLTFTDDD